MNDIDGIDYCDVCHYFAGAFGCTDGACRRPSAPGPATLSFTEFNLVNRARCSDPAEKGGFDDPVNGMGWGPVEWAAAIGEEAGEVLGAALGVEGLKGSKSKLTDQDLADEIADVVIYCDLLATRIGRTLAGCITAKFNRVSEKRGSLRRLPAISRSMVAPAPTEALVRKSEVVEWLRLMSKLHTPNELADKLAADDWRTAFPAAPPVGDLPAPSGCSCGTPSTVHDVACPEAASVGDLPAAGRCSCGGEYHVKVKANGTPIPGTPRRCMKCFAAEPSVDDLPQGARDTSNPGRKDDDGQQGKHLQPLPGRRADGSGGRGPGGKADAQEPDATVSTGGSATQGHEPGAAAGLLFEQPAEATEVRRGEQVVAIPAAAQGALATPGEAPTLAEAVKAIDDLIDWNNDPLAVTHAYERARDVVAALITCCAPMSVGVWPVAVCARPRGHSDGHCVIADGPAATTVAQRRPSPRGVIQLLLALHIDDPVVLTKVVEEMVQFVEADRRGTP